MPRAKKIPVRSGDDHAQERPTRKPRNRQDTEAKDAKATRAKTDGGTEKATTAEEKEREITFLTEEDIEVLMRDIEAMCKHHRYRRRRMGVRRVNNRLFVYEGNRANIKCIFDLPSLSGRVGQMIISDAIITSMIRSCGGHHVRLFAERWGRKPGVKLA